MNSQDLGYGTANSQTGVERRKGVLEDDLDPAAEAAQLTAIHRRQILAIEQHSTGVWSLEQAYTAGER